MNIKTTRLRNKLDFEEFFNRETQLLKKVEAICKSENKGNGNLFKQFTDLTDNYSNLLNNTAKIIKISDSNQRKLKRTQVKLETQIEKIRVQNKLLKELNATKDKFFSIISHDLRNPLSSIMTMLEVLRYHHDKQSKEEIIETIEKIDSSFRRIYELLENLLRWAKSQSGNIEFMPMRVNLNNVVTESLELMRDYAEFKKITITVAINPDLYVFADLNMLQSIIRNLLSNAVKFSNYGGEIIIAAASASDGVRISVEDNGIGINKENLKNIFRIDGNLKTKGTANEKGSGLGLILCKEFVEKHGGTIKARSATGEGTTITFILPNK